MNNFKVRKILILCSIVLTIITFIGCMQSNLSINNEKDNNNGINMADGNLDEAPFEVTVLNTGKSDCILIQIDDKTIMIDTGTNKNGEQICKLLKEKNIDTLDYLILTHMDKDHIGGVDSVLNQVKVTNLVQADYIKDSKQYEQYIQLVEEQDLHPIKLHKNINTEINGAKINIYPALKNEYSESNDYSIIIDITYGEHSFLFAGDAEEERLAEFLSTNKKQYNFLKLPHHGRYNKLSEEFLKSVKPTYGVITCSEDEMADDKVLQLLEKYNITTFLTLNGDVVVKSDGKNINIVQE